MKHAPALGLIASLALFMSAATPIAAQVKLPPNPAGNWRFATEKMGAGCALSGDISITRTSAGAYKCSFKALWACEQRMPRAVHTEQTCVATQTGSDVVITSKIEKVSKVDPVDMLEPMRQRYAADHFNVKINARGDQMDGMFKSYGQAPVIFRKHIDLIG